MSIVDKLNNSILGLHELTALDVQEAVRAIKYPYINDKVNPYTEYESVLLDGGYSSSIVLQDLVLNLYNYNVMPRLRLDCVASLDWYHIMIFHMIVDHYSRYREGCENFIKIAAAIREQRGGDGKNRVQNLTCPYALHRTQR